MYRIRRLGNLKFIFCLLCVNYFFYFFLKKKPLLAKISKSIKLIKRISNPKVIVRKSKIMSCVVTHAGFFQMKVFPVHWQILPEQHCFVEGCDSASSAYFIASWNHIVTGCWRFIMKVWLNPSSIDLHWQFSFPRVSYSLQCSYLSFLNSLPMKTTVLWQFIKCPFYLGVLSILVDSSLLGIIKSINHC